MKLTIDATPELMGVLNKIASNISSEPVGKPLAEQENPFEEPKEVANEKPYDTDITIEEVRRVAAGLIEKNERESVEQALTTLGVEKLSDLPEAKYGKFVRILREAVVD